MTDAIRAASQATGVPFDYLLRTAQRESSLDPAARARTSTASGLFQFIDQTWLATLKEAGPAHGYRAEADAIERRADGRFFIADPAQRDRIMAMRFDPAANAAMGAAFTARNTEQLTQSLGRAPSEQELYVAHFLGPSGASRFLSMATATPEAPAATAFPDAARANRAIFYERTGTARSFAAVRERLFARHPSDSVQTITLAAATGMQAQPVPQARVAADGPVFHTLFHPEGRGPVSGIVQSLWAGGPASGQVATALVADRPSARPFFPTSVLRVGVARAEPSAAPDVAPAHAVGAIQTAALSPATEPPASAPAKPRPMASVAVPLPPERPVDLGAAARQRPRQPVSRNPLDLLAFTRGAR